MKDFSTIQIDDNFIISNFTDKNGRVSGPKCSSIYANKNVLFYLNSRFNDVDEQTSISEIIYRIQNHLETVPKCPICGKRKKFVPIKHYMPTCGDKECIYSNMENTFLSRYRGKSGFGNNSSNEKIKQAMLDKFGVDNPGKSEIIWKQMKENGTLNKSKEEDAFYEFLLEIFPDLIRNYKSALYNYFCDFYIPSLDLYIEYHGSMFHHGHLFNSTNQDDLSELKRLESSLSARNKLVIYTWTILDVKKYNTAVSNKLNYLLIYPLFFKNSRSKVRSNHVYANKADIQNYLQNFIYNNYKNKTNVQYIIGYDKFK